MRKPHCAFDELLTLGDIETRQTEASSWQAASNARLNSFKSLTAEVWRLSADIESLFAVAN